MTDRLAASSYPADDALLAELRAAWPPMPPAEVASRGYATTDLAAGEPAEALRLTDRLGIVLVPEPDGSFLVLPLARGGATAPWRLAVAGDGLSAFVAGVPTASERAIEVDQTNTSVVVGERAIIKWHRRVGPGPSRAAALVNHLDAVGFAGIPAPLGTVSWRSPAGNELALAQGDAFLAGARDGWEWCVERLERHVGHGTAACLPDCDPWIGTPLGALVTGLHAALATPSSVIATPGTDVRADTIGEWRARAFATLDEAVARTATDDPEAGAALALLAPGMRTTIERLSGDGPIAIQPVHGDLHVGQVLAWSGGLAVIDFDGNPTLDAAANVLRQPVERDLAQMLSSLDHVGRIVDRRTDGAATDTVEGWIARTRREFLAAAGGDPDRRILAAFEIEQECRELVYAARFLPRWRYAPLATLRARFVS